MKFTAIFLIFSLSSGSVSSNTEETRTQQSSFQDQAVLFIWNTEVSFVGFFVSNLLLYQGDRSSILKLSCIEVSKNIINYALLENKGQWFWSALLYYPMNVVRERLGLIPRGSVALATVVEVLKAGLNFEVTEKWFPVQWSEPPENPQNKLQESAR